VFGLFVCECVCVLFVFGCCWFVWVWRCSVVWLSWLCVFVQFGLFVVLGCLGWVVVCGVFRLVFWLVGAVPVPTERNHKQHPNQKPTNSHKHPEPESPPFEETHSKNVCAGRLCKTTKPFLRAAALRNTLARTFLARATPLSIVSSQWCATVCGTMHRHLDNHRVQKTRFRPSAPL
jgi:hypothetical protein